MRVTWITHYTRLYGANRSMLDLILELRRTGAVAPAVIAPDEGPLTEALQAAGIPWDLVPLRPWMSERPYMGGPHHRFMQFWRHRRAARARAAINRGLLPALQARLRAWDTDIVHLNSAAVPLGHHFNRSLGIPVVRHVRELPERQYLLHIDAGRRAYAKALRSADRVIAISEAVRADILRYTGSMDVPVVYNGVLSCARQEELHALGRGRWTTAAPFTFLLLGLIHPSKGQEEAVEALAILRRSRPEARLLLIGDGNDRALRATIARTGQGEAVELRGFVDDPFPALLEAHTLLMCSRNEAMGRVTVEAMACGLPVIGHASGGTLELVEDGRTGLLYPGGAEELAERMAMMMNDPMRAAALGDAGAACARERFSIERYAEEVAAIHRAVLSRA